MHIKSLLSVVWNGENISDWPWQGKETKDEKAGKRSHTG